jgi:hypothetical protein
MEDTRPQLAFGVTVDVSGSITGNSMLVKGFTKMSKFYLSLLHSATQLHRGGVWYGLSAIGEHFHEGIPMAERHACELLEMLISSDDNSWMGTFNDHSGINTVSLLKGLREKWENTNIPKENRLEIIFTDGGETSGTAFDTLREMSKEFERDTGVILVFVGIGTREVTNYLRYILLPQDPKPEDFINIVSKLGVQLTRTGKLPLGDLIKLTGVSEPEDLLSRIKMPAKSIPLAEPQRIIPDQYVEMHISA